jgi:hypothetical protein
VTISANSSFQPQVDQILRMALQLAGILPLGRNPSAQELSHARDHLNASAKSMAAHGAQFTQLERKTLPLVAGTAEYTLDSDTIEIEFPMSIQQATTGTTSDTWIEAMVYDEWQKLSNKTFQATPTSCYVEKAALVTLVFWPVPNQAFTLKYRRQRLMRDFDSGTTPDSTQRWIDAWVYTAAHKMCMIASLPQSSVANLKELRDEAIRLAQGREHETADLVFTLPEL